MKQPYLLFDGGGSLVFPHQIVLARIADEFGQPTCAEQVFALYCQIIYEIDAYADEHGALPEPFPKGYAWEFYRRLGLCGENLVMAAEKINTYNREHNLWAYTFPWVRPALEQLAQQGYRMAVISNSDGRVAQIFHELALGNFFERVFDSHILQVEKPHPRIFEIALEELNLNPADAIYIGDVFHIDVVGANRAGLAAIHLDPLGLYDGWPGVHIPDITHLSDWLSQRREKAD